MASGTFKSLSASLKSSIGTVPSGKTVQGQIDSLNSNLQNLLKSVNVGGRINENGLSAGDNGYVTLSVTIPTGYKTTGAISISLAHPGTSGGMVLTTGVAKNLIGTITLYISYYTPHAITGTHTDYSINILCVKSDSILN